MTDIATTRTIETVTEEIRALRNQSLACAIEIGRRLCEAKELLPHGEWGGWLKTEIEFSQSSANKLMQLFNAYGSPQSALFGAELNSPTFTNLSISNALRLLALPEDEREEFVEEHDVEHMSSRDLDKAIKERDEAKKAQEDAEQRAADIERDSTQALAEAQERADKLDEELDEKKKTVRELSEQLEELKSSPIDVTVAPEPDPEKLQAAIDKAKAEVQKEKKKEIADLETKLKAAEKEKADAQKAKDGAAAEKQTLVDELAAVKRKTDDAEKQLENLRKAQAMSDPVVTEFGVIYKDVQAKLEQMIKLMDKAGDRKPNLQAAFASLIKQISVSGEAGA